MEKETKPGPKLLSPYPAEIEEHIKNTYCNLSEKDRRAYAAIEALKLPRGGMAYILRLLGCSKKTLCRGIQDLENYNGPHNLNQLLSDMASVKSRFKFRPEKEVHEKDLQWEIQSQSGA